MPHDESTLLFELEAPSEDIGPAEDTGPAEPTADAEDAPVPLRDRPVLASEPVLYTPRGERLAFPGCHAVRVTAEEIDEMEGPAYRFEYWDGDVETAWFVSKPISAVRERSP